MTVSIHSETTTSYIDGLSSHITKIVSTYQLMSYEYKVICCIYIIGFITYNLMSTYSAGISGLNKFRVGYYKNRKDFTEFDAIKEACYANSWYRIWESITWPSLIFSESIPYIIIALNSETPTLKKTNKRTTIIHDSDDSD